MFKLDIYFDPAPGTTEDMFIQRSWNHVPDVGDTIVYEQRPDDGETTLWSGVVKERLFITNEDGHLRVQVNCSAAALTDIDRDEPVETL